ncbi:hypothetical protein HY486_03855 [Candidatus Woesearchaeota archaeon]|nr:hypothetical protein [Candidatus Woesearchaeota archaeon]
MLVIDDSVGISKSVVTALIKPVHKSIFLLVNVVSRQIFAFSQAESHSINARDLLNKNKELSPGDIVSGVIEFSQDRTTVIGILSGASSWELSEKVKHSKSQLENAHAIIHDAVLKGGLRLMLVTDRMLDMAA